MHRANGIIHCEPTTSSVVRAVASSESLTERELPRVEENFGQVTASKISSADSDCSHEIERCLLLGRKAMTNPRQDIKNQRHQFVDTGPSSQSYGFSSSRVWM